MKCIRVNAFGGPEVLQLEDTPAPIPGPGQLVISIRAAGVNPVETYVRAGTYSDLPRLPYTPGSDGAGTVALVGDGVTRFQPGDRVFTAGSLSGTYAEQALCDEGQVHALPAGISFEQGAAIGVPYATAYRALFQRGRARPGERVLVHGASGGVGIAAVQLASAAGLEVIGTAGSDEGRKLVLTQGAEHVLDHGAEGYLDELMRLTGGRGVDLIIEMLANVNLGRDLGVLGRGGRVVVVGSRGTVTLDPRDLMNRDAEVLGMRMPNASPAERASIFAALEAGLAHEILRPVVGERIPLAEAARAHREVLESKAHGKIVLVT